MERFVSTGVNTESKPEDIKFQQIEERQDRNLTKNISKNL